MKLEDQVCTLEQARRLKELGVKQASVCAYGENGKLEFDPNAKSHHRAWPTYPAAFTVAELGTMLTGTPFGSTYWVRNFHDHHIQLLIGSHKHDFEGKTEAEARAAMLIYLLEGHHMDVKEINNELVK